MLVWLKTRTLATQACDKGNVRIAGKTLKPAHKLKPGDELQVGLPQAGDQDVDAVALVEAVKKPLRIPCDDRVAEGEAQAARQLVHVVPVAELPAAAGDDAIA